MSELSTTIQDIRYRYNNDPQFRNMVSMFYNFMTKEKVQPYEVKDAVYYAELLLRQQFVSPIYFNPNAENNENDNLIIEDNS